MPVYALDEIREEFVTPKHSTAFGRLITGEQIEVGLLRFKAGEGAKTHSHPHEQIIVMLRGRMKFTLGDEVAEIGRGHAVHIPPNVPHSTVALEDVECVSCKGVVGGVGHRI
jgi:quercetin dioxygenase-like cupin family protein